MQKNKIIVLEWNGRIGFSDVVQEKVTGQIPLLMLYFLFWPVGMGTLGFILGVFFSSLLSSSVWLTYFLAIFNTLFISFLPFTLAFSFIIGLKPKQSIFTFVSFTIVVVVAVLVGESLNRFILSSLIDAEQLRISAPLLNIQWIPSVLLTLFFSWTGYFLWYQLLRPAGQDQSHSGFEKLADSDSPSGDHFEDSHYLKILVRREELEIPISSIVYLTAFNKKTILHTINGDIETSTTLKSVQSKLPREQFLRIHKSHSVNVRYVRNLEHVGHGTYQLILGDEDETNLPIGRVYLTSVRKSLRRDRKFV